MRVLAMVIGFILLLAGAGLSSALTWRDFRDAGELSRARAMATSALGSTTGERVLDGVMREASGGQNISETGLQIGGAASAFAAALSLAVLAVMFSKKPKLLVKVAGGLVVLSVLVIFANPDWAHGDMAPASARQIAEIAAVPLVLGALAALLVARLSSKTEAS